jgi:hypothetical protein
MADVDRQNPRPRWVRLVVPPGAKRRAVLVGVGLRAFLLIAVLFLLVVESGSTSLLGRAAVLVGVPAVCLLAGSVAWSWLAARWVDRNDKWA